MPGVVTSQYQNIDHGGVRVMKVITTDALTDVFMVKKYLYNRLSDPNTSSGLALSIPIYKKIISQYGNCNDLGPQEPVDGYPIISCDLWKYDFYSYSSNSNNNIYRFSGSPVAYRYVTESQGENFENGGTEYEYTVASDLGGGTLMGEDILGAPLTSYAWKNGREVSRHIFKKQGSNYIPVKKIITHFKDDLRKSRDIKAYIVSRKYDLPCESTSLEAREVESYDLYTYSHLVRWVYVDTIKTWTYDNSGQNYIEDIAVSEYANPTHALCSRQFTYASDGSTRSVNYIYPQDIILTGSDETARQALVTRNMISAILQQQVRRDNVSLYRIKTSYNIFPNGLVLQQSDSVQTSNNPTEERRRFFSYNNQGKLLEQAKTNDFRYSYVWNDLNTIPIAEVINASAGDIAYTSFESFENGNWTINSPLRSSTDYFTGTKGYSLSNGNISKGGLTSSKIYIISYWSKNGSYAITGSSNIKTGNSFNGWTYYQHMLSGQTTVVISGSGVIDELRLYPSGSQMISATYAPLIGSISQSDVNSSVTHFEYDGLGRLKLVRDEDRNILKTYDYQYQQSLSE